MYDNALIDVIWKCSAKSSAYYICAVLTHSLRFKNRTGLGFMHLNARSLVPKLDMCHNNKPMNRDNMIKIWVNTTNADIILA